MNDCIFCKIRDKKIPAKILYEDDAVMAFPDINPVKKVHILVVPKKHIEDFLQFDDDQMFKAVRTTIQTLIKENKLEKRGYRISVNGGGAQIVNHLHFHLIGPLGKAAAM